MLVEVVENPQRVEIQVWGRLAHRTAKHAHGVRDVRARVHGAVQQRPDQALIGAKQRAVDVVGRLLDRRQDVLRQVLAGWSTTVRVRRERVTSAEGARRCPVRCVGGHEFRDVLALAEVDVVASPLDLDAEEVGDLALVLDVPSRSQVGGEARVKGVLVGVRAEDEQVVDVDAHQHDLVAATRRRHRGVPAEEHAGVEHALLQARGVFAGLGVPTREPGEERPLPAAPRLGHAVDRLGHDAHTFDAVTLADGDEAHTTVDLGGGVSRRWRAVRDFTRFELALEVGGHEIPSAHAEAEAPTDGAEQTEGASSHGGAEGLIIVHAGTLRAALHAQPSLLAPVALHLEDPRQLD